MDVYNPVFRITWPGPGATGISIGIALFIIVIAVYLISQYLKIKNRDMLHNYQLFLFQVKRKGLTNFQIKILNNMASYLKLKNSTLLVKNAALFESVLSEFTEYLKKSSESSEDLKNICRDLVIIYEKLYIKPSYRGPLDSIEGVEDGQVLYVLNEDGTIYLGKVSGRDKNFLALRLFTPAKNMKNFNKEQQVSIYFIRINDAEYRYNTKISGIEENRLSVDLSGELVKEKEYRHPYISVIIPAVIIPVKKSEAEEDAEYSGTIYRMNEYECELRIDSPVSYEKDYTIMFEVSDYLFKIVSKVVASRMVDDEKVYYITFKFTDMTKPAVAVLNSFITDHM